MLNFGQVNEEILHITKSKLGLTSIFDDTTVQFALMAAKEELLRTYGLTIDETRADHVNLISDMAVFNFQIKGERVSLPRHIEFRINNLMYGELYE